MNDNETTNRSLRESAERFRQVFEEGPLGMAFLGLDLKFLDANDHFTQLTGYTDDELKSLTLEDLATAEDKNSEQKQRDALLIGDAPFFKLRMDYTCKDGQEFCTITSISLFKNDEGNAECFFLTFEDVTELLKQTEKVERMNAKMIDNEVEIVRLKQELEALKKN